MNKTLKLLILVTLSLSSCKKDPPFQQSIIGFSDKISYFQHEKIKFYFKGNLSGFQVLTVYDINGIAVDTLHASIISQKHKNTSPYKNGFNFELGSTYSSDKLKSGIYTLEKSIPFVIKSKTPKQITVVYPSNTIMAYNNQGGKSMYGYNSSEKSESDTLSFLRPHRIQNFTIPFFSWLNNNYSNVGYIADIDLDSFDLYSSSDLLIIPGHSEYWTRKARENFDLYINSGKHAAVLSGNTMWWQVRYNENKTKLICHRSLEDPILNPLYKTVLWNNPILDYSPTSSIGADFTLGGFGLDEDDGWNGYKINSNSILLQHTGLKINDIISIPTKEYDGTILTSHSDSLTMDLEQLNFHKGEVIGYDLGNRNGQTIGTFIAFQKTISSGIIVNTGSTDWCGENGFGGNNKDEVKQITSNIIYYLLNEPDEILGP